MIYLGIILALIKILNYDYFGLFAAARNVIGTTKPTCQKTLCLTAVFVCEATVFVVAQCSLLASGTWPRVHNSTAPTAAAASAARRHAAPTMPRVYM